MPDLNLFTFHRFTSVDRCNARRMYRHLRESMVPSKARLTVRAYCDDWARDAAYVDSFGGE